MLRDDGSGSGRLPGWIAGRLCTFLTVPILVVSTLPAFAQRGGGHGGSPGGGGYSGSHGSSYSGSHGGSYSAPRSGGYSTPRGGGYSTPRSGGYSAVPRGTGYSASRSGGRYTTRSTGYSSPRGGSPGVSRGYGSTTVPPRSGHSGRTGTASRSGYHGGTHGGGHPTYHYSHYPHYGGYWSPYYGAWGWGWYPWSAWSGWWWGGPWWGWGWGWWPTVTVVAETGSPAPRGSWGIVSTDIQPEESEVWLDGTYIGTADDFDGNPDYLYLRPGAYKLEFRLANYEPLPIDLSIARGEYVSFGKSLKLEPGRSALDAFPPASKGMPSGRYFGPDGKQVSAALGGGFGVDEGETPGIDDQRDREPRPRRSAIAGVDRGRLRFSVTPEDAAIYVDNRYVGVGEDLNGSPRGVIVGAGVRSVTVMRPGFKAKTVEIEAKVGQPVDVVVDLEKQ